MTGFLGWLSTPLVYGLLIVAGILLVAYLVIMARRALASAPEKESGQAPPTNDDLPPVLDSRQALRRSFRTAVKALKERRPGPNTLYRSPWVLAIGPEGSGLREALDSLELAEAFDLGQSRAEVSAAGVRWRFYDAGVFLDASGRFLLRKDGSPGDEKGWNQLGKRLVVERPERPLEGVVLPIPVRMLTSSTPAEADSLRAAGRHILARLRELQARTGVRVPIYVLITEAQDTPGFTAFAQSVPKRRRGEMLGWSSPFGLEEAFDKSWILRAMDDLYGGLARNATSILARGDAVDPDAVFSFPGRVRTLTEPLQVLLTEVFRPTAYHEGFFLRGVYLTGRVPLAGEGESPKSVFLRDVLQRKVFPERGLARPVSRGLVSRNRSVRWAQAALVALVIGGGIGLMWGRTRLEARAGTVSELLTEVHRGLLIVRAEGYSALDGAISVHGLLNSMSNAQASPLRSVFIPASWVSPLHRKIPQGLISAFEEIVLPELREKLLDRASALSTLEELPDAVDPGTSVSVDSVVQHLDAIAELGRHIESFNASTERGMSDLDRLRDLVSYAFNEGLPAEFNTKSGYYGRAFREATHEKITPDPAFRRGALFVLEQLVESAYDGMEFELADLGDRMVAAELLDPGESGLQDFRALQSQLRRIRDLVEGTDAYWFRQELPLGVPIQQALGSISSPGLVDTAQFNPEFRERFDLARSSRSPGLAAALLDGGPGVAENAESVTLSADLISLDRSLSLLLEEPFFRPALASPGASPPDFGGRPIWDLVPLDRGVAHLDEFHTFVQGPLLDFPSGLRPSVRSSAARAVDGHIREALSQAMTYEVVVEASGRQGREMELQGRLDAFQEAGRRLVRLMEIDVELGQAEPSRVTAILVSEALDLLTLAEDLFQEHPPFMLSQGSLEAWDGTRSATEAGFGLESSGAVPVYVEAQRARVEGIVTRFVAPVMGYLQLEPVSQFLLRERETLDTVQVNLVPKWAATVKALDSYGEQRLPNSVSLLGAFVRDTMSVASAGDCAQRVLGTSSGVARDHFLLARERLQRAIMSRCRELVLARLRAGYATLQGLFGASLATRYPFTLANQDGGDADRDDVLEFLRAYDATIGPLGSAGRELVRSEPGGGPVAEALERIDRFRELMSPFLDGTEGPPPGAIEFEVDFRAERRRERGGDQVAVWLLDVAGRTTRYGDLAERRVGTWRPGDPISIRLSWASESAFRPDADGLDPEARVDGADVVWAFAGNWGLLRLYEQLGATSSGAAPGLGPDVIHLSVPIKVTTESTDADMPGSSPGTADLFIRLGLRHPVTKQPLAVRGFPRSLPGFPESE